MLGFDTSLCTTHDGISSFGHSWSSIIKCRFGSFFSCRHYRSVALEVGEEILSIDSHHWLTRLVLLRKYLALIHWRLLTHFSLNQQLLGLVLEGQVARISSIPHEVCLGLFLLLQIVFQRINDLLWGFVQNLLRLWDFDLLLFVYLR